MAPPTNSIGSKAARRLERLSHITKSAWARDLKIFSAAVQLPCLVMVALTQTWLVLSWMVTYKCGIYQV